MAYLFLVLLAVIFALLGFLLHAFCFSGPGNAALLKEVEAFKKALEEKQKEAQEAQEEIIKTGTMVRSLEEQIRRRNEEMESLQHMVAHQDDEIRQLQKDAVALQVALGGAEKTIDFGQPILPLTPSGAVPGVSLGGLEAAKESASERSRGEKVAAGQTETTPAWRDNLNNILNILDSMEKEIDK